MLPSLPHRRQAPRPAWRAPAHSCDCHFHVFGPYDRFPLDSGRHYEPATASVDEYLAVADALGIERMVIVQPSVYGTDNRCTLDAARRFGVERTRVVAVVPPDASPALLRKLHDAGTRGVRFNAVSGNGTPLEALQELARRVAPLDWHLQLYLSAARLVELGPVLAKLPVPVVLDHMGGAQAVEGTDALGFQALLRLLDTGRAWVKLCGYRSSSGPPFADVAPLARALLARSPERCVWGTDWPHPNLDRWMPEDGELLERLGEWAAHGELLRRVLVENPSHLYGFPLLSGVSP
jgi:predicted TIM-barrel fold metal-dependent hydrolase